MKKSALLAVVLVANLGSAFAGEITTQPVEKMPFPRMKNVEVSRLTTFDIDPALKLDEVNGGSVEVNFTDKLVTLSLDSTPVCRPGVMCPRFIRLALNEELPLVSVKTGPCGETIITAAKDLRRVDGALTKLVIVDNKLNHCPSMVAYTPVTVDFTTQGGRASNKTDSHFTGDEFMIRMY